MVTSNKPQSVSAGLEFPVADRLVLISLDSHVSPVVNEFRPYCEAKYRGRFDEFVVASENNLLNSSMTATLEPSEQSEAYWRDLRARYGSTKLYSDMATRLADMDADGVVTEAIFHGGFNRQPIPFFSRDLTATFSQDVPVGKEATELREVGIRTYNRWLADWVSAAPERFIGIAHIPMWDIEAAIAEVVWARENGLRGVNLPSPRNQLLTYNCAEYDPFWAACVDQGMALHTHGGGGQLPVIERGQGLFPIYETELFFAGRRGLWQMIFGGVFERFPQLKLVLTEQSGGWLTDTLQTLDSAYLSSMNARETPFIQDVLPKRPSEYFRSNVLIGASFMARYEAVGAVESAYWKNMLWGRDYPHPEGTWPFTAESLRMTFAQLPEGAVRGMLGENAMAALGLDRSILEPIARRIGPTFEQVNQPLTQAPEGSHLSFGFREVGSYA